MNVNNDTHNVCVFKLLIRVQRYEKWKVNFCLWKTNCENDFGEW